MSKVVDSRHQALVAPFAAAAMAQEVEKQMERNVKYKDIPAIMTRVLSPTHSMIAKVANAQTRSDLSLLALAELLMAKGIITQEEYEAQEAVVTQRFVAERNAAQEAAQSPAQREAQELAGEKPVVRLTEPVGETAPAEESISRNRLVEA